MIGTYFVTEHKLPSRSFVRSDGVSVLGSVVIDQAEVWKRLTNERVVSFGLFRREMFNAKGSDSLPTMEGTCPEALTPPRLRERGYG